MAAATRQGPRLLLAAECDGCAHLTITGLYYLCSHPAMRDYRDLGSVALDPRPPSRCPLMQSAKESFARELLGHDAPVTARGVPSLRSPALEPQRESDARRCRVRGAWLLSDGREVLLTDRLCMVADADMVYRASYPREAGAGLALQCVMAVPAGSDPFMFGEP